MSEDGQRKSPKAKRRMWNEFECPECEANNPWPNEFGYTDEIFCQWCGQTFVVKKKDDEGFKLVAT